jgi:hypothetical protein
MKKINLILLVVLILGFCIIAKPCMAETDEMLKEKTVPTLRVKELRVGLDGIIIARFDQSISYKTPDCAAANKDAVSFSTKTQNGKNLYLMLSSAFYTHATIEIEATGTCSERPGFEDVRTCTIE